MILSFLVITIFYNTIYYLFVDCKDGYKLKPGFKIFFLILFILCVLLNSNKAFGADSKGSKLKEPNDRLQYVDFDFFNRFNDELLLQYIIAGISYNHNLKALRLKINEMRQMKNMEISKEFPSLSVGANYLGLKIPHFAFPYQGFRDNAFALPFITHWEIDLFGKRKNKIEMKREDLNASIYEEKGAVVALAAEIAGVYFNIANLDEQINIQNRIIENKKDKLKRAQKRFDNGVLGKIELNNAKKEVYLEKIVLNDYKKRRETFLSNLAYLTGEAPNGEYEIRNINNIEYSGKIPDSIASDVVLSRPDLLQKEANLKKAKIDVLLARKEFLPNINVFGILMFSTLTPNFLWKGAVANLVAGATEKIFTGGERIFNIKHKKYEYERVLNEYLDTDLKALKEVNDALYNLKTDDETYRMNLENLGFEENNFVRISNSYKSGVKNRVDVLDKENSFLYEKSTTLNSKVQKFVDLISLYKALGGCL